MKPIIIINFKTYKEGLDLLNLSKIIEKINKDIIVGVSATDIYNISHKTKLKVYSQHIDNYSKGRNTGYVLGEAVKKNGAVGVFINHSEHKISNVEIKETISKSKKLKLKTIVFVENLIEAKNIEKLKPTYIVFEPKKLVGGKVSVSKANPKLIKKISESIKTKFLIGAGIKTKKDIDIAIKLGASGVLISSAIMKSKNPIKKLKELL